MYIHQCTPTQYHQLCRHLQARGQILPLDPSYTLPLYLPQGEFLLKLQPEPNCQIALLHALQVDRSPDGPTFVLITEPTPLRQLFARLPFLAVPGKGDKPSVIP